MSSINIEQIKRLREETGVAIIRIREVLQEVGEDEKKALNDWRNRVVCHYYITVHFDFKHF